MFTSPPPSRGPSGQENRLVNDRHGLFGLPNRIWDGAIFFIFAFWAPEWPLFCALGWSWRGFCIDVDVKPHNLTSLDEYLKIFGPFLIARTCDLYGNLQVNLHVAHFAETSRKSHSGEAPGPLWGPFWDPQILQNWARSLTKSPPNRKKYYFWRAHRFQDFLIEMRGQFSPFLGPPRDPQIFKKRVFPENVGPTTVIFSIFALNAAATNFFIENSWIFDEKNVF